MDLLKLSDRQLIELGIKLNDGVGFGRDPARMNKNAKIEYLNTLATPECLIEEAVTLFGDNGAPDDPAKPQLQAPSEDTTSFSMNFGDDDPAPPVPAVSKVEPEAPVVEAPPAVVPVVAEQRAPRTPRVPKPAEQAPPSPANPVAALQAALAAFAPGGGITEEQVRSIVQEELGTFFSRVAKSLEASLNKP